MSAGLILAFSGAALLSPDTANAWLVGAQKWTLESFDWLFAVMPIVVFGFCALIAALPVGGIRLGGADAKPEFSLTSWIAMLFAAGVGVGFMYYGSAEPLTYFTGANGPPLNAAPESSDAHRLAFSAPLFHWGVAAWGIYAVVGLALGFFAYNKGLPLTIRSAFYPLLGERIWGWPGHAIDIFAVISTVFGLSTTIGIAATQATGGLARLIGFDAGLGIEIGFIAAITGAAVVSVLRGMDAGVKALSNLNIFVALALMIFVIVFGPTASIFKGFFANFAGYLADTPRLANWVGREADKEWFHDWTIFYWAWWISWSPFVGMFIARISKGRTIREYLAVVMLAPFVICLLWFTAFGETAISLYRAGDSAFAQSVAAAPLILFQLLEGLPATTITSGISIALLVVFIVTSADSGALVVDSITSGGKTDAPVAQRVFWAAALGLTASALLYGGGGEALRSLRAGTVTAALPFSIILLASCVSLYMGLRSEAAGVASKP